MSQIHQTTSLQSNKVSEEYHEVVSAILRYIEKADQNNENESVGSEQLLETNAKKGKIYNENSK